MSPRWAPSGAKRELPSLPDGSDDAQNTLICQRHLCEAAPLFSSAGFSDYFLSAWLDELRNGCRRAFELISRFSRCNTFHSGSIVNKVDPGWKKLLGINLRSGGNLSFRIAFPLYETI